MPDITTRELKKITTKRRADAYNLRRKGKTFREIGEAMGISLHTARNHYMYALHDIKRSQKRAKRFKLQTNTLTP